MRTRKSKNQVKITPVISLKDKQWHIFCPHNNTIPADDCYSSYIDVNALGRKGHICYNCAYGVDYRKKLSEGVFDYSLRNEFYIQLSQN